MGKKIKAQFGNLKYYRLVFLVTFLAGVLIHFYKISHNLLNHDSIYNYYSSQNIIASGRWFLSVACSFSTWYDLPWVTGIFTMLFIAATAVIVVDILKIKNVKTACLSGIVLISAPAITETLFFGYTSDGFALAMLLSSVSVWFSLRDEGKKIINYMVAIACLTLSIGTYQAYLSFALVLFIAYAIKNANEKSEHYIDKKLKFIGSNLLIVSISMTLYFLLWKLLMLIQNITPTDYQGIDNVGFDLNTILSAPLDIIKSAITLIFGGNIIKHGISFYAIFNVIFVVSFVLVLITFFVQKKVYKNKNNFIFFVCCVLCIPLAIFCWRFTSSTVSYAHRMLESASVLLILFILMVDQLEIKKIIKNAFIVLIALIVFNNSLIANICYFYLQQENDTTLSMATEMISVIHDQGKSSDGKVFIQGSRLAEVAIDNKYDTSQILCLSQMIEKDLLFDEYHTVSYLNNSLNCNFSFATEEEKEQIIMADEYKNMTVWPMKGSVKVIDEVIVIKYTDDK